MKVKQKDIYYLLIGLSIVSLIYSFISVNIHNHFMTFGLDLGNFDEAIWKISKGIFPYSGVGCNWLLEDHFQVILYFFAPLYWLWNDVRALLVAQSFIMIFAGLPLYLIAKKVTKNISFSISVVFTYIFFIGTQFSILNEFHQITAAPLFIAILFYSLVNNNFNFYILSIIGLLITKEDLSLLVSAIGIGLLFTKKYKRRGFITAILGFTMFFFLIYIFMPFISIKGVYDHFDFGSAGYTPFDVIRTIMTNPVFFLKSMIFPLIKLKTIFQSFSTFGFFPIFSPIVYLIPLIEDFVTRFVYSGPQFTKWGLVNHHAAPSSMLLSVATIYGALKLQNIIKNIRLKSLFFPISALVLISMTILNNIVFHGPINSILKKQFYEDEQWIRDNRDVISKVPPEVSLAAQNNLLPHLTHRNSVYRLPYGLNSEYIMVDLHDGPNKYAPLNFSEMKYFVHSLLIDKRYNIVYQKGDAFLLKRNFKTDITKSKYYGDTRYCYYSYEER